MTKGWQLTRLGDCCEVIAGQSPEGKFYNAEGRGTPFYQGKKDFGEKFLDNPSTWTTQATKMARKGDILMSVRAPVGPVNFAIGDACIGRGLAALRCSDQLNLDFLFFQLLHLQPEIAGKEGAVFASISKAAIEALPLAITTLPEQRRIVRILDEAFAGLATAKANAEKNLQNARALFESHLQAVFSLAGSGWKTAPLGDICETGAGGTPLKAKKEYYLGGRIPWLLSGEVSQGEVREASHFITQAGLDHSAAKIFPCDTVLVAMYGATAGEVGILRCEAATNQAVCGIYPNTHFVPKLLFYLLLSRKAELVAQVAGNAQPNISQAKIRNTLVPVIPHPRQLQIVETLDALARETQVLASAFERKLAALAELKASLLRDAFTGAL